MNLKSCLDDIIEKRKKLVLTSTVNKDHIQEKRLELVWFLDLFNQICFFFINNFLAIWSYFRASNLEAELELIIQKAENYLEKDVELLNIYSQKYKVLFCLHCTLFPVLQIIYILF